MSTEPSPPSSGQVDQPDDVAAEMVRVMLDRNPALAGVDEQDLTAALAEVLPVYGAIVQVRTFGHDYQRREQSAQSLTKRVYGASVLLRIAAEADRDARAGVDPATNRALAAKLRTWAHREGGQ